MIEITSQNNPKYKYFKSLQQKKERMKNREYVVEGIKSVNDAKNSDKEITAIIISETFKCDTSLFNAPLYKFTDSLFNKLCDTKTPQGIMAVLKMEDDSDFIPEKNKSYVYCDGVSDPGNVGTIIRTADAAGFDGVILSKGSVDIYAPKTVRASMGSFFNIKLITEKTVEDIKEYKKMGFSLIGGVLSDNSIDYRDVKYTPSSIIIIGNEANGISKEVSDLCVHTKIPIYGNAESLNAGVAGGILMYEWSRNVRT